MPLHLQQYLPHKGHKAVAAGCTRGCRSSSVHIASPAARKTLFEAVTAERAFLPEHDPTVRLPPGLQAYEDALQQLPKHAVGSPGRLRRTLLDLPPFDLQQLPALSQLPADNTAAAAAAAAAAGQWQQLPTAGSCYSRQHRQLGSCSCDAELWRAYMVLSFLSHAYLWCDGPDVPQSLPLVLSQPWACVSAAIGMPPVLVYATYNLMNWTRLNTTEPLGLGNIACQHNFLGGVDEEWFRLVHVAIEAAAAPAMAALQPLQQAAAQEGPVAMEQHLTTITASLQAMQQLLARMGERCDPYIYYKRVRVPMSGWRNNPALPQGLVYEGLWGDQPQQLYGETGAQSALVPALDVVLGIKHKQGWLQTYLTDMRVHMPPSHRAFLEQLESGSSVREAVQLLASATASSSSNAQQQQQQQQQQLQTSKPATAANSGVFLNSSRGGGVVEAYDAAVFELEKFRAQHRGFAKSYIAQWSQKEVGTGGSDFMPALTSYKEATAAHKLSGRTCPLHQ